ncbi:UPF1 [Symbiodinium natans]|uniref:UPF1 protein n=1 Tax=Symbiodinium natans TaxID=878477 RepID=A0A812PK21_9DINO|nr:UPF1 [Symbiodinium natans]
MVGLAQALRADGFAASEDEFLHEVSKLRSHNAEEKLHSLLSKHNLSLPIPIQKVVGKPCIEGFPRLRPLDVFKHMQEAGHLNKLLGGKTLASSRLLLLNFWENYRNVHPDFELFAPQHEEIPLEDCVPILAHIDGGRGYKKSEFMIFNWGPMLGTGCGKRCSKDPSVRSFRKKANKFHLALLGHSYTTHYLYAAMPSAWHKNNEDAFQSLLNVFAEDLRECFDEGIAYNGRVLRLVLLGLKGDLKMQARAGCLTRWFTTARKRPYNPAKTTKSNGMCCWLCPAGHPNVPFEEVHSKSPAWLRQMPLFQEPPWDEGKEGGMLPASLGYLNNPGKFYFADLFHIYLHGVGQDYCASALIYMLPFFFKGRDGNSVDKQLDMLNEVFTLWRKMHRVPMHLVAFTRDKLTYPDATKVYPSGTWSKAADTPRIVQFLLYMCELHPELCARDADKTLFYIRQAAESISDFMQRLYKADLWIDSWLLGKPRT